MAAHLRTDFRQPMPRRLAVPNEREDGRLGERTVAREPVEPPAAAARARCGPRGSHPARRSCRPSCAPVGAGRLRARARHDRRGSGSGRHRRSRFPRPRTPGGQAHADRQSEEAVRSPRHSRASSPRIPGRRFDDGHAPTGGQSSDQASTRAPGRHRSPRPDTSLERHPSTGSCGNRVTSTGATLARAPDGTPTHSPRGNVA
jgi:hypothetical protein